MTTEKNQKFVIIIVRVLFLNSFHSAPFPCCFLEYLPENRDVFVKMKTFSFIQDVDANNLL